MSKISYYPSADEPLQLSDRLIGTEAPRIPASPTPLATKNFSLGELLQLFSSNFPAASLQAVLDTGNTATQNITLTGTIDTTLIKPDNIEDTSGSQGLPFQFLSKGALSINWVDLPVDNLQAVLNAGNTATQSITLIGNITSTRIIPGNIQDDTTGIGTTGQFLSKTALGIRWVNAPATTTPGLGDVLSVNNTAINNINLTGNVTATSFIKTGGTNLQYLMADGSVTTGGGAQTLQQVLDNNHDLVDNNNFQGTGAGIDNTGAQVNAFGFSAARENTGNSINALGINTCYQNTGDAVNALGDSAAQNNTGIFVNALGQDAANANTGTQVNALGTEAANQNEGGDINAFGNAAASLNTGNNVNAFGNNSSGSNSGNNVNAIGFLAGQLNTANNVNAFGYNAGNSNTFSNVNLFGENATADENGQIVFAKDDTTMARISTTDLTATRKYNLPDGDGTLALTSNLDSYVPYTGATNDVDLGDRYLIGRTLRISNSTGNFGVLQTDNLTDNRGYQLPDASGTIALTSDIPTSSGIPHATASGTDTYTATVTGVTAYNDADAYLIRFTNGNTTGATLNINSLGAIPLYRNNDGVLIGGDIISGGEMLCVYNSTTNRFQVIGTAPNSLFAYVTNDDSVTLTKGMPVYAFGGTGDRMTVKRANNTGDATSAQTVGLVLSTSIAANQKGLIMMQGLLDGLSILPTATWSDGDAVYLGATPGSITNIKPYAPNHLVYLGVVTTASNGAAGRMYVRVQNGYELQELHNVQAQSPSLKDTLWYDNTVSPAQWKTASIPTILGFTPEDVANKQTNLTASATKYPTVNAVNTGLALKQNILSYTPYRNIQTSQTVYTGTTAETVAFTATIPAGAFSSTDIIKVLFGVNKINASGTYSLRLRVNTTNNVATAPTIALYSGTSTAQVNVMMRNYNLNGGNLYGFMFTTSGMTDIAAVGGALGSTALNPANQFFIFATVTLNNSGDSIIGNMLSISN